jgi:hypothetical protein
MGVNSGTRSLFNTHLMIELDARKHVGGNYFRKCEELILYNLL